MWFQFWSFFGSFFFPKKKSIKEINLADLVPIRPDSLKGLDILFDDLGRIHLEAGERNPIPQNPFSREIP